MRALRWSAVVFAVVILAGCGQAHRQSHGRTLHLTAKDNRREFTVKPHETIVLTLAFTRRPGYSWQFAPASQFMLGFRQLSQHYVPSENGAPAKEIWHYRPVGRGGANLGVFYGKVNRQHTRWLIDRRFDASIDTG